MSDREVPTLHDLPLIDLTGSPDALGRLWGELNAADLRAHLAEFCDLGRRQHGLSEAALIERSHPFGEHLAALAPHWLVEAEAIAAAAGVDPALYLACLAGRYRGLLYAEECTSYAAVGTATAEGRTLFHKNRDNRMRPQAVYRKHTVLPGDPLLPFVAVGDTSDTGVMMMVNAAGLAGSADQAGPDPRPRYRGLMNPYGLRHIAETATCCDEAIAIVREMTANGQYAGGAIATNWAFADRHGDAVVVYNRHDEVTVRRVRDGWIATVRREGLDELLDDRRGRLTVSDFNAGSRLPGVCVRDNCSSLTVVIDPDHPAHLSVAWAALGRACQAPYVPLPLGAQRTPLPDLDGQVYALHLTAPAQADLEACEAAWVAQAAAATADAREALSHRHRAAATARLEDFAAAAAAEAVTRFGR